MSTRLCVLLCLVAHTCPAQIDSSNNTIESRSVAQDGLTAVQSIGHVAMAPTRWEGDDWVRAGGMIALTTAAFFFDDETSNLVKRNRSAFSSDVSDVVVEYGTGYFAAGLIIGTYLTSFAAKDDWLRETAVLMGGTVLFTSAATTLGKFLVGRARPYTGLGSREFIPLKNRSGYRSFPSGHTTNAFAISAVLASRIKHPWACVGLYGVATLTAVSRIYSNDHWLSDVVFAAAYSTAVAHSIVYWFESRGTRASQGLIIIPASNGVSVVWRF